MFVCFSNAVNTNKVDALPSLKEMNLPLDNVLFFENDCLLPFTVIEDEDYRIMSGKFWARNEKNFKQLLMKCESTEPICTEIFVPVIKYKTFFFKLNFGCNLQKFNDGNTEIQRIIHQIRSEFQKKEIEKVHCGIIDFINAFASTKNEYLILKELKTLYHSFLSEILKDYPCPKNKYFKEYILFLKESQKIDTNLFTELYARVDFENYGLNENFEQETLLNLLLIFENSFKNAIIDIKLIKDEKLEFCCKEKYV